MLKIAFFGGDGEGTMVPLEAVGTSHRIVTVVTPESKSAFRAAVKDLGARLSLRKDGALSAWARAHDVPVIKAASGGDRQVAAKLARLAPDAICVSAFPWILADDILKTARLAALNVHSSLLPRHRGPVPLFWIYYHGDRRTGVTVHEMNARADAGQILAQTAFDLERGLPVDELHARNAACGAELLKQVVDQIEAGDIHRIAQDDAAATYAPHVKAGVRMVDFQVWGVEQVWHFLGGLCCKYREPLMDDGGRAVAYESVLGYEWRDGDFAPGTVRRASHGWDLHCRDGIVRLGDGAKSAHKRIPTLATSLGEMAERGAPGASR